MHDNGKDLACLTLSLLLAFPVMAASAPTHEKHLREAAKYRLELDNDAFVGSDNQFSSGWSFQYHSAVADDWHSVKTPADWLISPGEDLPGLQNKALKKRFNISVGQIIQTPGKLNERDRIKDDVPYAAIIAAQSTWLAYDNENFQGYELSFGIVGPAALGRQSQNFVHRLQGINEAKGWNNQLNTEPVFNVNVMRKKKFYQHRNASGLSWDATLDGHAALGTMFTLAALRLETRFGHNMPGGFMYSPDPIGHSMIYDASLKPPTPTRPSLYGSASATAVAVAHNLLLDGNVFRNSQTHIDKEPYLFMLTLGVHYETPTWGAHMDLTFTTDTVETSGLSSAEDADNAFGTFMFEWKV